MQRQARRAAQQAEQQQGEERDREQEQEQEQDEDDWEEQAEGGAAGTGAGARWADEEDDVEGGRASCDAQVVGRGQGAAGEGAFLDNGSSGHAGHAGRGRHSSSGRGRGGRGGRSSGGRPGGRGGRGGRGRGHGHVISDEGAGEGNAGEAPVAGAALQQEQPTAASSGAPGAS